jgi:hypothetical protein
MYTLIVQIFNMKYIVFYSPQKRQILDLHIWIVHIHILLDFVFFMYLVI